MWFVDNTFFQVSSALNEEIRRLSTIVDEFEWPFDPDAHRLSAYKKVGHMEQSWSAHLFHIWNLWKPENLFTWMEWEIIIVDIFSLCSFENSILHTKSD